MNEKASPKVPESVIWLLKYWHLAYVLVEEQGTWRPTSIQAKGYQVNSRKMKAAETQASKTFQAENYLNLEICN